MADVTGLLHAAAAGDPNAAAELLPLVYDELRKLAAARMARETPGQTIQATALVHDAYLRLAGADAARHWNGRGHFFAAAAEAMRRILVDKARQKQRLKRGGGVKRVDLDAVDLSVAEPPDDLPAGEEVWTPLGREHPDRGALVKWRSSAGLTVDGAAGARGISPPPADRHWTYARAWLYRRVAG